MISNRIQGRFILFFIFVFMFCVAYSSLGMAQNATTSGSDEELFKELEGDFQHTGPSVKDPLEPINRVMFKINDKLYYWVFKPTGEVYRAVFPQNFRISLQHAFHNIKYPIRAVNSILEFKFGDFFKETGRFVVNTLLGFGGLIDVARGIPWLKDAPPDRDTGVTLGYWGIGNGFYIVLPVLGPCTLRDAVGKVGDYFLDPVTYVEPETASVSLKTEEKVNYLSLHITDYDDLKKASLDPYISFRNAYIQYRNALIKKNH